MKNDFLPRETSAMFSLREDKNTGTAIIAAIKRNSPNANRTFAKRRIFYRPILFSSKISFTVLIKNMITFHNVSTLLSEKKERCSVFFNSFRQYGISIELN